MMCGRNIFAVRIELRYGVRFVRLVDGGAYGAKQGKRAACGLDLLIGDEGEHDAHDCIRQRHGSREMCIEGGGDDQNAEKAQREFLCRYIGSKEPLHCKIGAFTFGKRTAHTRISSACEIERLDDVHTVQLLKHGFNEQRLRRLPFRCEQTRLCLHSRRDP